jgi:hypothetical protein
LFAGSWRVPPIVPQTPDEKRHFGAEVLVPRKTAGTVIAADNQLALAA